MIPHVGFGIDICESLDNFDSRSRERVPTTVVPWRRSFPGGPHLPLLYSRTTIALATQISTASHVAPHDNPRLPFCDALSLSGSFPLPDGLPDVTHCIGNTQAAFRKLILSLWSILTFNDQGLVHARRPHTLGSPRALNHATCARSRLLLRIHGGSPCW